MLITPRTGLALPRLSGATRSLLAWHVASCGFSEAAAHQGQSGSSIRVLRQSILIHIPMFSPSRYAYCLISSSCSTQQAAYWWLGRA
ncbi:hypothetical protein ASPWEDRAFT_35902 [Aspergillus wentii DTO 134E9]|uniref:Uncharacterized protein n=1 Tax=Aspergillus wentii DTO 134E9 TaxID=1073089 RepID=A0A1L9RTM8_ASPWE|nr:uncharacterized protein ASPWEDRAFT_35902 [Aspergillus wentii DTO 134E9]OJJ38275.1 hypothetical protein ASPWEDRAFT_35902 [Aspergillus wentii DTO 134E9]